ncbi:MAG: T9SS type A sorting domain-containing protein [Ignavibacteria bacterium]|nr:T9SS type A sorting domain-containing protein [Ignavibacteria bacterium]
MTDVWSQQVVWRKIIGEQYDEIGRNVIELKDKGYLMVGLKQVRMPITNFLILQSYIVKLNRFGDILWEKIIGDSVFSNTAISAIEDKEGNIYLLYRTSNAQLMKLNALGNILWNKSFSDIVILRGGSFTGDYKNFVFLSETYTQSSSIISITKIDTSGNLIWNKTYSGPETGNNSFLFLENEYYICGGGFYYGFIIKTDSSGNLVWNKRFYGNRGLYSIAQNSENTFIASGNGSAAGNLYILKFNNKGDSLMGRNYVNDTVSFSIGYLKIVKNYDGNFALGTTCGWNFGRLGMIDSSGNFLKSNYYYYPENISVCQWNVNTTSDSGFILTGDIGVSSSESFPLDALIYKIDKYGNTVFILNNEIQVDNFKTNIYPNPFNGSFKINFDLIFKSEVKIELFDINGKLIKEIENSLLLPGNYPYYQNAENFNSGIYFLKFKVNESIRTEKIVLIK